MTVAQTQAHSVAADEQALEGQPENGSARSQARASRRSRDPTVSWQLVHNFSIHKLMEKYQELAPLTWGLVYKFIAPMGKSNIQDPPESDTDSELEDDLESDMPLPHVYRPKHIVSHSTIARVY